MALNFTSFELNAATAVRRGMVATAMALGAVAFGARAEPATTGSIQQVIVGTPNKQLLNDRECIKLTSLASRTIRDEAKIGHRPNPEFAESLAGFISPTNSQQVKKLIAEGTFSQYVASLSASGDETAKRGFASSLSCDGSPRIGVDGRGIDMWNYMKDVMFSSDTTPVDLNARGLIAVSGKEYKAVRAKTGPQSQAVPRPAARPAG